jgi:hypothetical protein
MSQFQIPGAPSVPPDQPAFESGKTSGLAISSLICSLICCLPFTTIPGILLGAVALVSIGKNPALKGRGLAFTGIVLGVLFTIGQVVIYPVAWKFIKTSMEAVAAGPRDALTAGFAGDVAGFKAEFYGSGANATDAEAQAFIDELRDRYGAYIGTRFNEQAGGPQPGFGQTSAPFPYVVEFENATVDAETEIVFSDPQRGGFIMKIGSITVFDDDLGDLTYPTPEGGTTGGEAQPAPAMEPASDEDEPGGGG